MPPNPTGQITFYIIATEARADYEEYFERKDVGINSVMLIKPRLVRIIRLPAEEAQEKILLVDIESDLISGEEQTLFEALWLLQHSDVLIDFGKEDVSPLLPTQNLELFQAEIMSMFEAMRRSARSGKSAQEAHSDVKDGKSFSVFWFLGLQPRGQYTSNPKVKLEIFLSPDLNLWRSEGFHILGNSDVYVLVGKPGEVMLIRKPESEEHPNQLVIKVTATIITGTEQSLFEAIWLAREYTTQTELDPNAINSLPFRSDRLQPLFMFLIIFAKTQCKEMDLEQTRKWMREYGNPLSRWIVDIDVV